MAGYAYATLAQAQAQLATRLYDPTMTFWTDAELTAYLQEAIRTWNALTSTQRGEFTVPASAATEWYAIPALSGSLRPYTLTDQSLYSLIEYHLLEPQTATYPLTWTGSLQFSLTDLIGATQRRLDELLGVTACTITPSTVAAAPGRTLLPDSVIDIRRVAYIASVPAPSPAWHGAIALWENDAWSEQAYSAGYPQLAGSTPRTWLRSTQPPLSFDAYPPPGVPGTYDILTVNGSATLTTASSTLLGIPDDWAWLLKWGVLADLLSRESTAKDELRAGYCNQRYRQGLALLADAPAILEVRSQNVPIPVDPVRTLDEYHPGWQSTAPGAPRQVATAGLNLFALAPVTDSGTYSLTLRVVQNAPVPSASGDFLQVARDAYDVILDYAQHLAAFKQGGEEFTATSPLLDRFLHEASLYNSRLAEMAQYERALYAQSARELAANPRYLAGTNVGGES
jgi:hypothetical protein